MLNLQSLLTIPFDRPTITEIKAEFPDLFKKFPALKTLTS